MKIYTQRTHNTHISASTHTHTCTHILYAYSACVVCLCLRTCVLLDVVCVCMCPCVGGYVHMCCALCVCGVSILIQQFAKH